MQTRKLPAFGEGYPVLSPSLHPTDVILSSASDELSSHLIPS